MLELSDIILKEADLEVFRKELVWREFSYHLLHHWPELSNAAFRSAAAAYDGLSEPIRQLIEGLSAVHDYGHLYEMGWRAGIPIAVR